MSVTAVVFFVGICSADDINVTVDKITKNRNRIDSYHLVIVQELEAAARPGDKREFSKLRYEVWRKGNKVRIDSVVIESTDKNEPADLRSIWCRNCEKEGHILRTSYRTGHSSTPITFAPIDSYSPLSDMTNINWPWLGLSNSVHWPWHAIAQDAFLKSLLITDPAHVLPIAEATEELGGVECHRFTLRAKKSKGKLTIWVDPSRDSSPIRLETINDNGQFESETSFAYPAKRESGIWFPNSITQRLVANRDRRTAYTIEVADLNRRIDDSVFSYGGLGVPRDTPVMIDGITDVMKAPRLRDGKLVYPENKGSGSGDQPPPFIAVPDNQSSWWWSRFPYIVGALLFALIGATLIRRIVRSSGV